MDSFKTIHFFLHFFLSLLNENEYSRVLIVWKIQRAYIKFAKMWYERMMIRIPCTKSGIIRGMKAGMNQKGVIGQ